MIFRNKVNGSRPAREYEEDFYNTHPSTPKTSPLITVKGETGVATCQGQFPCQTQWMGTNAWHSVETDLPTATLATIDSEGSVRGESSITRSKHRNAMTYHTIHTATSCSCKYQQPETANQKNDNYIKNQPMTSHLCVSVHRLLSGYKHVNMKRFVLF